jgi:hypothetical protein
MSGGRAPKRKGDKFERDCVAVMQDSGFAAERSLRAGTTPGRKTSTHDIDVPFLGSDRQIECKNHATGFSRLYTFLEGRFALIVKSDRREPLVVLRLQDALEVAKIAEKANSQVSGVIRNNQPESTPAISPARCSKVKLSMAFGRSDWR